MAPKKRRSSASRRLHRSLGAGAALFIIFMVLSGLAINHSHRLGLDRQNVTQSLLLDWYGLGSPEAIRSFEVDGNWLSFAGSRLYFNGDFISAIQEGVGAVFNGDMLVVAGANELVLLTPDGELIERTPWNDTDTGRIDSIGMLDDGTVAVHSSGQLWLSDPQLLNWQTSDSEAEAPTWSEPSTVPSQISQAVSQNYRGADLSIERLLLDLHSGRIFGSAGRLVYDLLAVAVGFLAISGLVFWARGRRNGKHRKSRS